MLDIYKTYFIFTKRNFNTIIMENEIYKPIMGFKGLDKNMSSGVGGAKKEIFELGKIYYKDNIENPKLCSTDGYHFCETLSDCFIHYSNNGRNRFFNIEVLGNFTHNKQERKSITTAFRLVSEIDLAEVNKLIENDRREKLLSEAKKHLRLDTIQQLQTKYPQIIIGGSVGLFLHGIYLSRLQGNYVNDLDLIMPYFELLEGDDKLSVEEDLEHTRGSGSDFEQVVRINGVTTDVRVDPKSKYEYINYDGFKYKVNLLENIMEAKWRYALLGNQKHKTDCYEISGKGKKPTININTTINLNDIPF